MSCLTQTPLQVEHGDAGAEELRDVVKEEQPVPQSHDGDLLKVVILHGDLELHAHVHIHKTHTNCYLDIQISNDVTFFRLLLWTKRVILKFTNKIKHRNITLSGSIYAFQATSCSPNTEHTSISFRSINLQMDTSFRSSIKLCT